MTGRFAGVERCSTPSGVLRLRSTARGHLRASTALFRGGQESGAFTCGELDQMALERAGRAEPVRGGGTRPVGSGRPAAGTRALPADPEARP